MVPRRTIVAERILEEEEVSCGREPHPSMIR